MKLAKLFVIFILPLILFLGSCNLESSQKKSTQTLEIEFVKEGTLTLSNNDAVIKELDIEIASDEYERENGLMFRSKMDENKGMLFIFDEPKIQTFWMKNTRIPLDIIYLSESKKVINIAKNTEPFSETGVIPSSEPAKYVLEVNAGSSDKWGILEKVTEINIRTIK